MSLEYIRNVYHVPARIGGRVRFNGRPSGTVDGTIVGTNGARLLVLFDDAESLQSVVHPVWEVEYLEAEVLP